MSKLRLFYFTLLMASVSLMLSCDDVGFPTSGDLAPVISVNAPTGTSTTFGTDKVFVFDILLADDNGLKGYTIASDELSINEDSVLNGAKLFNFKKRISVSAEFGEYIIAIEVTDITGNVSLDSIFLTKEQVLGNFVYAVGDVSWNDWDPTKAMPMEEDLENQGWFEITLFSDGDDDGVKFIGQLDWAPNNWGLVSTDDPSLGMLNDDSSGKILLEAGYNVVRFNPELMQYSVAPIVDALPASNGKFFVMGCGFKKDGEDIDLCWDPSKAYPMNQDAKNPYLYRLTIEFSDATDLKFNGNQAWDDLDWGFPEAFVDDPSTEVEEQKLAPEGEVHWTDTAKKYGADWKFKGRNGKYELILDEYLEKAQIRKIN